MTKLTSGRVEKVDSANVSADRYQFLALREAEPDLGLPSSSGQIFTSNTTGHRYWTTLDTANVIETSNLYFTNSRVLTALTNATIQGNLTINNVLIANGITINGVEIVNGSTGEANINATRITTNNVTSNIWTGLYTANVIESSGNLYYTNTRSRTAISAGTGIIYDTANGIISANTTSILQGLTAIVTGLTTANVTEAASNLYFTNARVISALSNQTIQGNLTVTNTITTNTLNVSNIVIGGGVGGTISGLDQLVSNVIVANSITINGIEIVKGGAGEANINATRITTNSITSNIWTGLYTANVIESSGNLYYTNARSRAALSAGTGIIYDNTTGVISIGQNVSRGSDVTFNTVTVLSNLTVYGNVTTFASNNLSVSDNMIYLNSNSLYSNPDLGFAGNYNDGTYRHTGFFRDATDGTWKVFDNYTPEPDANIFIDTVHASFRLANFAANIVTANTLNVGNIVTGGTISGLDQLVSNVIIANTITINGVEIVKGGAGEANINATRITTNSIAANIWTGLYTANVIETFGNLYFTNARSRAALSAGSGIIYDATNGIITANVTTNVTAIVSGLTTANIAEAASNLYFTNSRVLTALTNATIQGNLTINNVLIANGLIVKGVEIVTGGSGEANIAATRITTNSITSNIWTGIYTANVAEIGSNLYFTNARVLSALSNANIQGNLTINNILFANGIIINGTEIVTAGTGEANIAATRITTNSITSNIWTGIYTANVIESASNLYFTNARVLSALSNANIQGNLTINNVLIANGLIVKGVEIVTGGSGEANIAATRITTNSIAANIWTGLYTANVIESASNLYFTNARSRAALSAGSGIAYDAANGIISATGTANVTVDLANIDLSNILSTYTGNISAGNVVVTNRIFANSIVINGAEIISGNTFEANITVGRIYANTGVFGNVIASNISLGNLNAGNLVIGSGFGGNLSGVYIISTEYANVNSNLNAGNINVFNRITANSIVINGTEIVNGSTGEANINATRITTNSITSNIWTGIYTANVIETGSNLYFTNARARATLSAGSGIIYDATNGIITANVTTNVTAIISGLTTANIAESGNLYYTNARVYSNIAPLLTTANVNEIASSGNLYYSNARARTAISAGSGISYDSTTGIITANIANITANVTATINGLTTADVDENAASGNLYYTNARVYSNVITLLSNIQGIIRATGNITTDGNLIANGLVIRNINVSDSVLTGNVTSNASSSTTLTANNITTHTITANVWTRLYTSNVNENAASGNLYYTNARVYSNVVTLLQNYNGNIIIGNVVGDLSVTGNLQLGGISKSNITFLSGNTNAISIDRNLQVVGNLTLGAGTGGNLIGLSSITAIDIVANTLTVGSGAGGNISGVNYLTANIITANVWNGVGVINSSIINSNIINANIFGGGTIYSNSIISNILITANAITSNIWNRLYTANVIETSGNLYFTNARARLSLSAGSGITYDATNGIITANVTTNVAAIVSGLTTANIAESAVSGNLYYTNARARTAISAGSGISYDNTTGIISANIANITANVTATINGLTTADVDENAASGNLYYSNLRVNAYVQPWLTTANTREVTNLYFTNTRVYANIAPLLTTANVNEIASSGNLYYSNARVYANVLDLLPYYTGNLNFGNVNATYKITANSLDIGPLAEGGTISGANTIATTTIVANSWIGVYTSNVIEIGQSIYYTNARVYSNIELMSVNVLADVDITGINTNQILIWNGTKFIPGNTGTSGLASNTSLTTANVTELPSNLYYTNLRAYSNVISLLPYYTGALSGNNITATNSATIGNLIVLGNLYVSGNTVNFYANSLVVNDPMIQLGYGNPGDLYDLGFIGHYNDGAIERHAGFFRDHSDQKFKVFDNLTSEPGLNDIDTANATFRLAVIAAKTFEGNLIGNVTGYVSSISNFTTSNLVEGANLYFTNARVYSNIAPLLTTANVAEVINLYFTNARVYSNIAPLLTTANVAEVINLYFTNARVYANVTNRLANLNMNIIPSANNVYNLGSPTARFKSLYLSGNTIDLGGVTISATNTDGLVVDAITSNVWNNLYTANVIETASNLYFTNTRVYANISPLLTTANVNEIASSGNLYYSNLRVNAYIQPWLTTANVAEVTNLYFTNTRVYANIAPLLTTANVSEVTNLYFTNTRVYANISPLLTTANVNETGSNLYYSNARVYSNIAPLLTTANVAEVTNLYFTNTRVYTNVIALLANLVGGIRATGNIISDANIIANGLIIRNITVSDNVLTGNITANATTSNAIVAVTVYATGNITSDANLIANGLIIRNINVSDSVLTGSISSGNTISNVILADSITANTWNRLYTANVIETPGNLYFTNTRAISAFTAGKNISISTQGVIRSTAGSADYFNIAIDGSAGYTVTSSMANALVFPSVLGYKYSLRSLHVTNISANATYINGNIFYSSQNTNVPFLNEIYIPVGASVELIRRPHILSPGDIIRLQGYDGTNFVSSTMSATLTYETITDDPSYYSTGQVLPTANSNIILLQSSPSIVLDSLKFINLYSTDATVTAIWASESNVTKSYYSFNMLVPASSTVEILQAAKRLGANDKIIVNYSNIPDGYMSAFVSYKSNIGVGANVTSTVDQGGNVSINLFASIAALSSNLYYTIDPA